MPKKCLQKKDVSVFLDEADCLEQKNEQKMFSWTHEEINSFVKTLTPINKEKE